MTDPNDLTPENSFRQGRDALAAGDVEQACRAFCRTLDACPDALDDVAAVFGGSSDREAALKILERGENAEDRRATGPALAARLARDLGRLDTARRLAEQAADRAPHCASWWFELAEIHVARGGNREAASAYRRCLSLDRGHALARQGLSLSRRGRWKWAAGGLSRLGVVRSLLRQYAWAPWTLDVLERQGSSLAAHQMRWARALEHGSAMSFFVETPAGMEPENFGDHMKTCDCIFWKWFLTLGIDREVRRVIDVGCGPGFTTEHFVRHGCEVTGVTVSPYERDECRRRGIKVLEADFHFIPAPERSYDLLFSSHSLEHASAPLFALWEWRRILRPGGYALILIPLPVEQDARAAFPDRYDPQTDRMDFPPSDNGRPSREEMGTACSTYGAWLHVFVLSYWQLRWAFQLTGFELVSEAVEDLLAGRIIGAEHVDGRRPRNPNQILNGMFLLRKPQANPAPTS